MADSQHPPGKNVGSVATGGTNAADPRAADTAPGFRQSGTGALAVTTATATAAGRTGGWRSFIPPNRNGKSPWRWRWLGLLPLLGACMLTGWWAWGNMEDGLNQRALAHLECEGIDTSTLDIDWSYRSVTVDGELPAGVTASQVERIIDQGSSDTDCVVNKNVGFEAGDDPGVYNIAVPAAIAAAVIPDAEPTATPRPEPSTTPVPEPTATPEPAPSATPEPTAEPTPVPQVAALTAAAVFDGETITLSGQVATDAQRAALVAAAVASVGEANVIDQLTVTDGDPTDTSDTRVEELSAVIAAFGGPNVVEGRASVTDDALTYDVLAPSDAAAQELDLAGTGSIEVDESPAPSFTG